MCWCLQVDLKKSIIEELRERADELKAANFALYRAIEFNKYLEQDEAWTAEQTKKSKIRVRMTIWVGLCDID